MRYQEFNKTQAIRESMSFSARKQDPKTKAFMPVTGDQPRYEPDFYKPDWPYDKDPKPNPDYNPEEDLSLSNANMREVMDTLGYDAEDSIPIDEFIGRATQFLKKSIGKLSPEQPDQVDQRDGGGAFIDAGKPEGYFQKVILAMSKIARIGKERGATHVVAI
jgi:hypothetical protein